MKLLKKALLFLTLTTSSTVFATPAEMATRYEIWEDKVEENGDVFPVYWYAYPLFATKEYADGTPAGLQLALYGEKDGFQGIINLDCENRYPSFSHVMSTNNVADYEGGEEKLATEGLTIRKNMEDAIADGSIPKSAVLSMYSKFCQ